MVGEVGIVAGDEVHGEGMSDWLGYRMVSVAVCVWLLSTGVWGSS